MPLLLAIDRALENIRRLERSVRSTFFGRQLLLTLGTVVHRPPLVALLQKAFVQLRRKGAAAQNLGLPRRERYGGQAELGPDEFRPMGLARRLGVSRGGIGRWLRSGYLNVRRDEDGHAITWADADELKRLRELGRLFRAGATGTRLDKLKKLKRRPQG